ncbi:MAG: hypothetical protein HY817_04590 [Candidatus Abawacabacteria bacterium]|nr:hypothetical protein [Candidatus Abawacabacteria bacterium]
MALPALLFVTNFKNSDPEEDIFLANYLQSHFAVTIMSPAEACQEIQHFSSCLVRNAWPSRILKDDLMNLQILCRKHQVRLYNPIHRSGYVEDKHYLVDLHKNHFPVIPTINNLQDLSSLGEKNTYMIKPLDGSSSWGVEELGTDQLGQRDLTNYLIQPKMDLKDEVSFYFIDDRLTYTLLSAGPNKRWELHEYEPTTSELSWATNFVTWNKLPYGLQRIDACRMADGSLYLMEIEDQIPFLSLDALTESRREHICLKLIDSLKNNLF